MQSATSRGHEQKHWCTQMFPFVNVLQLEGLVILHRYTNSGIQITQISYIIFTISKGHYQRAQNRMTLDRVG